MARIPKIDHVKTVERKGKFYLYFRTNRLKNGRPILARLPDFGTPTFWTVYGSYLAGRNREVQTILTVPNLVAKFYSSPKFGKLAPTSQKLYRYSLAKLCEALPTAPANEIERSDIANFLDTLADKPGTANAALSATGALYRWARRAGHVTNEPTKDIDKHELGEHEPWPDALLDEALASDDEMIRTAVGLLYYTAQRIGDVIKMRWDDIPGNDFSGRQTKTRKLVEFPVHRDLRSILSQTPKRGMCILTKQDGRPYTDGGLRIALQAWASKRGHIVVPHGLRKNAVNALLECGCSVAETASISGQTLQMVEHYAKRRKGKVLGSAAILKWEGQKRQG